MKKVLNIVLVAALVVAVPLSVFAATYDIAVGGSTAYSAHARPKVFVFEKELNLATSNATSADVFQMINIPEDTMVLSVVAVVSTAEGAALTFDVGDGANADGWIDGASANVTNVTYDGSSQLLGTLTWYPGSLTNEAQAVSNMTVTGAAVGDFVLVAPPVDVQGMLVSANVISASTVEIVLQNEIGATNLIDLASGVWKGIVFSGTEAYAVNGGKLYKSADTIDITINTAAADAAKITLKVLCANM